MDETQAEGFGLASAWHASVSSLGIDDTANIQQQAFATHIVTTARKALTKLVEPGRPILDRSRIDDDCLFDLVLGGHGGHLPA